MQSIYIVPCKKSAQQCFNCVTSFDILDSIGTMWCMENEDPDEMMSNCKESVLVREENSVTVETPSDASDQWIWPEWQTTSLTSMTSGLLYDLVQENE